MYSLSTNQNYLVMVCDKYIISNMIYPYILLRNIYLTDIAWVFVEYHNLFTRGEYFPFKKTGKGNKKNYFNEISYSHFTLSNQKYFC